MNADRLIWSVLETVELYTFARRKGCLPRQRHFFSLSLSKGVRGGFVPRTHTVFFLFHNAARLFQIYLSMWSQTHPVVSESFKSCWSSQPRERVERHIRQDSPAACLHLMHCGERDFFKCTVCWEYTVRFAYLISTQLSTRLGLRTLWFSVDNHFAPCTPNIHSRLMLAACKLGRWAAAAPHFNLTNAMRLRGIKGNCIRTTIHNSELQCHIVIMVKLTLQSAMFLQPLHLSTRAATNTRFISLLID